MMNCYVLLLILAITASVVREYINTVTKDKKSAQYKAELRQKRLKLMDETKEKIRETKDKIKKYEMQSSIKERTIIQLMTSNNQQATQVASLNGHLKSVKNEYDITGQQLSQIKELNSQEEPDSSNKIDTKTLENIKIENVILQNNLSKLSEKITKYNVNNQKIIKTINETTIKNFEIYKENEDVLARALNDIQAENTRLHALQAELVDNLRKHKLKIIDLINDLNNYKDSNVLGYVNLKIMEIDFIAEKISICKLKISKALITALKMESPVSKDTLQYSFAEYMKNGLDLTTIETTVGESLDQKLFEIESIEHDMKKMKKKILLSS